MIEKVKLNEVAKDLNISGKDLTALLQQRFGGEAKKPQTVQAPPKGTEQKQRRPRRQKRLRQPSVPSQIPLP